MVNTIIPGNFDNDEDRLSTAAHVYEEVREKNHDLKETLTPQERDELRKEAVHILSDDKKIWHGSDHTGSYKSARYNRRIYAEAGAEEEVIEAAIKACQKGFWGERLSSAVPLEKAQTVFVSKYIERGGLLNLEMQDLWGGKEKPENGNKFLTEDEQKETVKEAISLLTKSGEGGKSRDAMPQTEEEWDAYIDRYGRNTVEPDAVLANLKTNKYVGPVEAKMYTEEEVRALVEGLKENIKNTATISSISSTEAAVEMPGPIKQMTLGANLEAEFHYIEYNIKGRSGYISEDPLEMFAVLRFPEDIPDDLLVELGGLMEQAHYAVAIQKIPFSNEEINMLAQAKIAKYLTLVQKNTLISNGKNGRFFTPRDIRIYEKLSDPKVEW